MNHAKLNLFLIKIRQNSVFQVKALPFKYMKDNKYHIMNRKRIFNFNNYNFDGDNCVSISIKKNLSTQETCGFHDSFLLTNFEK